jgi:hypothetical protein
VKQHRDTVGGFEVAGIASGQVAEWLKYSFALSESVSLAGTAQPGDWTRVHRAAERVPPPHPAPNHGREALRPSPCDRAVSGLLRPDP